MVGAAARGTPAVLQRLVQRQPGGLDGRGEPEGEARREAQQQREAERLCVERVVELDSGRQRRQEERQCLHGPRRQKRADRAAERSQEHALDEQEADEPRATGTEGEADRELLLARRGAGELQVRHVDGHDQEHGEADELQQAQHGTHHGLGAGGAVAIPEHPVPHVPVGVRVRLRELRVAGLDDRLRLLGAHAGLQPRHVVPAASVAPVEALVAHLPDHRGRCPHVERERGHRPGERRGGDADDREAVAVDLHQPADHAGVGGETPAPEPLADDREGIAVGRLVLAEPERAAEDRPDLEHVEEVRADDLRVEPLRLAVDGERHEAHLGGRGTREDAVGARDEVAQVEQRDVAAALVGHQQDHLVLASDARQRPPHDVVDPAPDRGVRGDAERERQDDDRREAGGSRQGAQGELEVVHGHLVSVKTREAAERNDGAGLPSLSGTKAPADCSCGLECGPSACGRIRGQLRPPHRRPLAAAPLGGHWTMIGQTTAPHRLALLAAGARRFARRCTRLRTRGLARRGTDRRRARGEPAAARRVAPPPAPEPRARQPRGRDREVRRRAAALVRPRAADGRREDRRRRP